MPFEDMEYGYYSDAEHKARMAMEFYEDGKIIQALAQLNDALQINPSNCTWHFNKALTLDSIDRFDEAIAEYELASQLNPEDPEILNALAIDYTRTGQYDRAIELFEYIQQLDPMYEPSYCNRIIAYTEMEQHDMAEQMFYLAQQIEPDCILCYYNIGNSLFIRRQYAKAIHCWEKTANLEPTHPQINYRIAQAYWAQGQLDNAGEYFLAELRLHPGSADVLLDFGLLLLEAGNVESAKEKFNRIIELQPDSAAALFYLGEIAFNNNDCEQAKNLFNEALEYDSKLIGPRYRLAQLALLKGQRKLAREFLVSEVELVPEDTDALVSMGSMFLELAHSTKTNKKLSRFSETLFAALPQNQTSSSDLDYAAHCLLRAVGLNSGCLTPSLWQKDTSENLLPFNVNTGFCSNTQAYYYLGLINAMQNHLKDAAIFFAHALDTKPDDVRTLRDSAVVYLMMGRLSDAAERIKKARQLADNNPGLRLLAWKISLAKIKKLLTAPLGEICKSLLHKKMSK